MERSRGFTILELVVTITVMTILMVLVAVRLLFTERAGRDQERAIDISAIARGLELYYQNGSPDQVIPRGYYPGSTQVTAAFSLSPPYKNFLEGVSLASYIAPDKTASNSFIITGGTASNNDGSYTDVQAKANLALYPYIYQPLKRDNTDCVSYVDCVKFNLYYLNESDNTVQKIRSKNQ